tara:strand:+ start:516 stop:986 length:471 start_codon:yes stop_codon:yes gene_type:complete
MDKWELEFLVKNFKSKYLTIHESSFNNLKEWKGLHKKLFLEMNYDNKVFKNSKVEKIGGFCIDLSHFKASLARWTHDFEYVTKKENIHKYFKCNHINGYSKSWKKDLHTVRSLKEFDYLKTLPKFIFGKVIAIETFNGISDQLKFKKYLTKILRKI